MAMNTRSEQSAMSEINVTPLVDVMLVLLIVFIVTAPLLMQAVKVNLPKTAAVSPMKPTKTLQMAIDAQGGVFIDQRLIHFETLEAELKKIAAQDVDPNVQIHADESVRYGRVAQVLAMLQRVGITKLAFVTTPSGKLPTAEEDHK
jgi:biopolymer transport protein ExbD